MAPSRDSHVSEGTFMLSLEVDDINAAVEHLRGRRASWQPEQQRGLRLNEIDARNLQLVQRS